MLLVKCVQPAYYCKQYIDYSPVLMRVCRRASSLKLQGALHLGCAELTAVAVAPNMLMAAVLDICTGVQEWWQVHAKALEARSLRADTACHMPPCSVYHQILIQTVQLCFQASPPVQFVI
jgi:hypothetical protein